MFTGPSPQRGIKGGSIPPGLASLQSTPPNEPPPQDLPYSHRTTQAVLELGAWLVQGRQDHWGPGRGPPLPQWGGGPKWPVGWHLVTFSLWTPRSP